MTDDPRIADPRSYYDDLDEGEWERLESGLAGELEFENTITHLERRLPDEGHVLDAGGGAGRYSAWLRDRGYRVTLLDVSGGQLEIAREKVGGHDAGTGFLRGSIHRLPFGADRFDATICLGGPLSHLVDEEHRRDAAAELGRVTAPEGPVFVSVMGLLHMLQLNLQAGRRLRILPDVARSGTYDAELLERHGAHSEFVVCHFFRAAELRSLLESAGLTVERIVGLEGVASVAAEVGSLEAVGDAETAAVKEVVDTLREDESVADLSAHILALAEV